jgi:hypothetical protein
MKVRLLAAAGAAVLAMAAAGSAGATIYTVNFTVDPDGENPWFQVVGSIGPFGLSDTPILTGSFQVDDSSRSGDQSGANSILNLSYMTGSRNWTIADLNPAFTRVNYSGSDISGFRLQFPSVAIDGAFYDNVVIGGSPSSAQVTDATDGIGCNETCVSYTAGVFAPNPVPEPSTWALAIGGLGLAGAALRRQRPVTA